MEVEPERVSTPSLHVEYRISTKYRYLDEDLRAGGSTTLALLRLLRGRGVRAPATLRALSRGNGPGLNSGAALERLAGEALARRPGVSTSPCPCGSGKRYNSCCAGSITLSQVCVHQRYIQDTFKIHSKYMHSSLNANAYCSESGAEVFIELVS